ncbi:glycerophosphoryl diester phosphodiesterase [Friedmanniella endophytica]|uniref:Glycerophosphoryl diester phosphodiesterase n=1 Tax=Microlunatus kandeliicorticis TaxID=1759536 RepID=A0A7W3IRC7_9ACTN|nr:glycerophosphodiester phosphodiesterase family protein [Microlunatus kandeliicorticis]MBA8793841.1 glycerophosphoryl diester phosphodiesterase [Microlunatus kandeliicorticis]
MTTEDEPLVIFAHRGFSGRVPEMTRAAYREAISFAAAEAIPLGLEADLHFAADDTLVCLHDLDLDRTTDRSGPVFARTTAQLREVDFGARRRAKLGARPDDGALVTCTDLLDLAARAIEDGVRISLNLETKHPNPRGFAVDDRVAALVTDRGWDVAGSPARVISFAPASLARVGRLLPQVPRTYLVERTLAPVADGRLPDGIRIVGPDLALVRADPDFVARARRRGNAVHVWTVNDPDDVAFCLEVGVTGFTTDFPDRVLAVLRDHGLTHRLG